MSKRLDVLKALTAHLEGITPANGYKHDLSRRVFRGRTRFGADKMSNLPMLSILESKAPDFGMPADEENTVRLDEWILLVQGWAKDDPINPTDPVYLLAAEVEARLGMLTVLDENGLPIYPGVYRLGQKIAKLTLAQPVVRPPEEGLSDTSFFFLPIRVGIKTDLRNP
ncbi:tail terminator [Xanthomonas phage XAP3]|nr:tail terminator [Xanthomonas phage XAP3]